LPQQTRIVPVTISLVMPTVVVKIHIVVTIEIVSKNFWFAEMNLSKYFIEATK